MRLSSFFIAGFATTISYVPVAQAAPPSVGSLITSASSLAASLKNSYPNPSIALLPRPYWWWQSGSSIDALLTYGSTTGDRQYEALLQNTILSQKTGTNDFMTPDATGNDDQAWWALAAMTAAENGVPQAGDVSWLAMARNVFNVQKSRWDGSLCGGGMRWKVLEGNGRDGWYYKNSITNGLFFQLAARLAKFTGDAEAQAWAERTYDWAAGVGLIDGDFNVYDGADVSRGCAVSDHTRWSYNVGVFLHGAAVMAAHTRDAKWTDRTRGFIASAKRTFVQQETGALFEQRCQGTGTCNTDQVSFRGTLARWLGASALILPGVRADVAGIVDGAAYAVQRGGISGLGFVESFTGLEVMSASLKTQGIGGIGGVIGQSNNVKRSKTVRRSIAGRISW